MSKKYKHRAVCFKECYWKENLWQPGEIYEGDEPYGKYFAAEGEDPPEEVVLEPGSDPRPNVEIKKILEEKYGFKVPTGWARRKMWVKLRDYEIADSKDSLTNPEKIETESHTALCGFEAKSYAGMMSHQRNCDKCQLKM